MGYILKHKTQEQYITYEAPDAALVPAKRGKVSVTGERQKAFVFATPGELADEKKRLIKKAKDFEMVCEGGPAGASGAKAKKALPAQAPSKTKRKALSKAKRNAVYAKTEGRCYMCGSFVRFDEFEVEHRIPVSCGGTNDLSNLFCACHVCNVMKSVLPLSDVLIQARKIAEFQESGKGFNA